MPYFRYSLDRCLIINSNIITNILQSIPQITNKHPTGFEVRAVVGFRSAKAVKIAKIHHQIYKV